MDYHMQGEFTRQVNDIGMDTGEDDGQSKMHFLEAPVFEKFVITSSSVSLWGDCYRRLPGNAYIFGQSNKTLASDFASLPVCFRCITLISRTPNVIQSVHQDERICYDSIESAERSCFFDHQISSPVDGQLLFRTEYYDTNSCVTQGSYDVEYELRGSPLSILECPAHRGSELSNCDGKNEWKLQFQNCSFSDFDLKLICLGKWPVGREIGAEHALLIEHYLAVQNNATGGYKCGVPFSVIMNKFPYRMS
ncbi:hypothetical protein Ddc_09165 [Ditylenchus destructor]|nr:hypothetical protein Ddc_09165 [Ditylenchus destructor]